MLRPSRRLTGAILLTLAAVSCKNKEEAPAVDTAAMAPAPTPAPVAAVSTIELGKRIGPNKRVTDTTAVFARRDTIYLAVVTDNPTAASTLTAKWTFQTGQVVDSTSQAVDMSAASGTTTVTEFHVSKPGGWPAGKYSVAVMLNGQSVGSRDFEVRR